MSNYLVSARKYRPTTFDYVVGQKALTQTLCNAITSGKLAHAYLFCGPRGVGKTTCARIFAKTINCEHRHEDGEACNECTSCRTFDEGRSLNILELDAASNNSVENIRDLIEQARIPPQGGRYKVFIIDEVHMLSSGAFNAFLKTLEEPPSYVIFILATTEKQKIIPTILSRCQIYDFKRIEVGDIMEQLKRIAVAEGISYEEDALRVIAEKADGGMRDALSTFDQEVIFTNGNITYEQVIRNLNILDFDYFFSITDSILKHDISHTLLTFDEIIAKGFDGATFMGGLARHMRNLMVCTDDVTLPLLTVSRQVEERYKEQASRCKIKFLYKALKLCNDCDLNYRTSRNKRLLVEITLIELVQTAQEAASVPDDDPLPALQGAECEKSLKPIFKDTAKPTATVAPAPNQGAKPVNAEMQPSQPLQQPTVQSVNTVSTSAHAGSVSKVTRIKSIASIRELQQKAVELANKPNDTQAAASGAQSAPADDIGCDKFDEHAFSIAWLRFADSLPKEESDIAGRMKGMKPQLDTDATVVVPVENPKVEHFMQPIVGRLEQFMRKSLNNRDIRIHIEVTEPKVQSPMLNATEMFKKMVNDNPHLSKINDAFEFELA